MKKLSLLVFFLILFNIFTINTSAIELTDIKAQSYILIDADTGNVLLQKNPDMKWRPASTTKIITGILAIEKGNLEQKMIASKEAIADIGIGGSNIGIKVGEEMTLRNLLDALLIRSANESSNIIAENISPTRQAFIDEMNKFAKELGAKNTTFYNACGMDNGINGPKHLSTARDMALIARHAMQNPIFAEIVSKEKMDRLSPTNKHKNWPILRTTNQLLWGGPNFYYFEYKGLKNNIKEKMKYSVTGIKTGYTSAAGNNLVASASNDDKENLISVIFGVKEKGNVFQYTKKLFEYGFSNFSIKTLVEKGVVIKKVSVKESIDDEPLSLVSSDKLTHLLPKQMSFKGVIQNIKINKNIRAPIKKGQILGTISYSKDGFLLGKIDLKASRSINKIEKNVGWFFGQNNFDKKAFFSSSNIGYFILTSILIVIAFLFMRGLLRKISRKRKQNRYKKNNYL